MTQVLLMATLKTKADEAEYLQRHIESLGATVSVIDVSIDNGGRHLGGAEKCLAMENSAQRALDRVSAACAADAEVVLGIGGGTGGEIILQVLRALPITFPKVLVTTMPFDPRFAVADNAIVLVPTLADINGLNSVLRDTLETTAAMVAGLCRKERKGELLNVEPSVGITALGVTDGAVRPLLDGLRSLGQECTVFHANGFGGAAYARFAKGGAFHSLIDLTPHEMTRLKVAGPHVGMPERFSAGGELPRITVPGGLNFFTLTDKSSTSKHYLARPNYAHSAYFSHVQLSVSEMEQVALGLAQEIASLTGPQAVLFPMGGFSSEDRPGGAIESAKLRDVCRQVMTQTLAGKADLYSMDDHILAPSVTSKLLQIYESLTHDRN